MVQVVEQTPGFGATFGAGLGQGISKGLTQSIDQFFQNKKEERERQRKKSQMEEFFKSDEAKNLSPLQRQLLVGESMGLLPSGSTKAILEENRKQQEIQAINDYFQNLQAGREPFSTEGVAQGNIEPVEADEIALSRLSAAGGKAAELAKFEQSRLQNREKAKTKKEEAYFKLNEPKLMEISDSQRDLEQENARFSRLQELFNDPSKFPPGWMVGLLSKEGELRPTAIAALSDEAQEAVKLIIDSTSGIKNTYGARVTNFDLQTYLRKLPSLLNSAEGKARVLRDLQVINQINRLHNEGIMQIFEEHGGSDKIAYSKVEREFNKRYGKEIDRLYKEFINPAKKTFDTIEAADPGKYLGKKMINDETGEVFISDGKQWKPYTGE